MKSLKLHILVLMILSIGFAAAAWSADVADDAKKVFVANKCNMCHSVEAAKIEKTTGGYQKGKAKNVPPDLSGIGSKRTAEWIKLYLMKKEKNEGVAHARLYKGSEADLDTLSKWLETLK